MPVILKSDVRFHSGAQAMAVAHVTVADVYREVGCKCRLTCGIEEHEPMSKHVTGEAFDYGIRDIAPNDLALIVRLLQVRLGPAFDVVLEHHHIHVEYDPKS